MLRHTSTKKLLPIMSYYWREHGSFEGSVPIEDTVRVSIRDNRDPCLAWHKLRTVYGSRLANTKAALLAELSRAQYDGSGILEHKSKMDALRMKLTEAGHHIPESLYLNFFVNSLPEEFDAIVNTIDYNMDTVDKVVSNLRQIETKRGLRTVEGSAFSTLKRKQSKTALTSQNSGPAQGTKDNSKPGARHLGKCYNCGGQGHWSNKCPSPRKKKPQNAQQDSKSNPPTDDKNKGSSSPSTSRGLFSTIEASGLNAGR
jgi:gag-polypeptide of LTR copia-type/Zinc knuckle